MALLSGTFAAASDTGTSATVSCTNALISLNFTGTAGTVSVQASLDNEVTWLAPSDGTYTADDVVVWEAEVPATIRLYADMDTGTSVAYQILTA